MADPQKRLEANPFNTLAYAKNLQSAGFTAEQAEVQAEVFFHIVQEQLVNKRDIHDLEQRFSQEIQRLSRDINDVEQGLSRNINEVEQGLSRDIHDVEQRLSHEIETTKKDLKIWFGTMLIVAVSVQTCMMGLITHLGR